MNPIKLDLNSTPVIFNKKLKKSNIKNIEYISSDTGIIRHFPPAAQEWHNSVYNYGNRYIKNLPVSDKHLMKLLKGYFNMYINQRTLKSKALDTLLRRRSSKKIFIGKGELKHTNSKVIITFYVHNTEIITLKREYINLYKSLYAPKRRYVKFNNGKKVITYLNKPLKRYIALDDNGNITKDLMGNDIIRYNRPYTLDEFLGLPVNCDTKIEMKMDNSQEVSPVIQLRYNEVYYSIILSFISNLTTYIGTLTSYYEYLTNLVNIKILNNEEKLLIFFYNASGFYAYKYPNLNSYKDIAEKNYLEDLHKLRYILKFNSVKFENTFIGNFKNMIEKLYSKKVEFNIVNLKKMHLNSDILTQAIVLKLKNRKNMFSRVLRSSLNKVNLPNVSRLGEKYNSSNKDEYLINKIRNTYIHDMFSNTTEKDPLNKLLLNFYPSADKLETSLSKTKPNLSLRNLVFKHLKHAKLGGVRLEAKGRLSRRFTAARSVFKLSWKGGLKNVDSSFKGLSTVMLRGDSKSNVEYSILNSKRRIGAFGIKGWISSK